MIFKQNFINDISFARTKEIQLDNISALLLLSSCICVPYFMSQIKFAYLDYFTNHPERITLYFICFLRTKLSYVMYQIRSDQSLSRVRLFATPWIAAHQASLSITNSGSSPRLTSIESVMPSCHLILCHPLLFLPPIPPSIRVFSNESTLHEVAKVLEFQL